MLQKENIRRAAALLMLAAACLLLTACGTEEPEVSLKGFTEAVLKMDATKLEKYGVKEDLKANGLKELSEGIKGATGGVLTEADCKTIAEAFITKFAELNVKEARTESKSGSEAKVAVTIDKVTVQMPAQAPPELQKRIEQAKSVEDLSAIIKDVMVQVVQNAPKDGTVTLQVECQVNESKNVWVPKDTEKFIGELLEKGMEMK